MEWNVSDIMVWDTIIGGTNIGYRYMYTENPGGFSVWLCTVICIHNNVPFGTCGE